MRAPGYICLDRFCEMRHPMETKNDAVTCGHCMGAGLEPGYRTRCEGCHGRGELSCQAMVKDSPFTHYAPCQAPAVAWDLQEREPLCTGHLAALEQVA